MKIHLWNNFFKRARFFITQRSTNQICCYMNTFFNVFRSLATSPQTNCFVCEIHLIFCLQFRWAMAQIRWIVFRFRWSVIRFRRMTRPTFKVLEVFCKNCQFLLLTYKKGGKGQLIKCHFHKIIKDNTTIKGMCPSCGIVWGRQTLIKQKPALKIIGDKVYWKWGCYNSVKCGPTRYLHPVNCGKMFYPIQCRQIRWFIEYEQMFYFHRVNCGHFHPVKCGQMFYFHPVNCGQMFYFHPTNCKEMFPNKRLNCQ